MKGIIVAVIICLFCSVVFARTDNKDLPEESKYTEKEVQVKTGNFILPGTLALPAESGTYPVVILVHGSGPANRDEAGGPNKPFRQIAHGLAQRGIASIRYDKRTYVYRQQPTGEGKELTPEEEVVEDALSAIRLAKETPGVDSRKIFLLGHSLGGMMAPMIASKSKDLAGIIIFSGPSRPFGDCLADQLAYVLSQTPQAMDTARINGLYRLADNVRKAGTDEFDTETGVFLQLPVAYWDYLRQYDQVETAAKLQIPILVMQGERDYQVTMKDFEGWKLGLKDKPKVSFYSYPKLNHLYMESEGPASPMDYLRPGQVASYVLDDLANWLERVTSGKRQSSKSR